MQHEVQIRMWNGLFCRVLVKISGDVIHVLDLDGDVSLTNSIGEWFQGRLLQEIGEDRDPYSLTWVLYHTDCYVTVFNRASFSPAPREVVDENFHETMMELYGDQA